MRKSKQNQSPGNQRPPERSNGREAYRDSYDGLEPPVRSYRGCETEQPPQERQVRGGSTSSPNRERDRRPQPTPNQPAPRSQPQYRGYDLNAFERERGQTRHSPERKGNENASVSHPGSRSPKRSQAAYPPPAAPGRTAQGVPRRQPDNRSRAAGPPSDRPRQPAAPRPGGSEPQYQNRHEQRVVQNSRRAKRLKRRRIATAIALFLTVAIVAVVLCCTVFFKIDKIQVQGTELYSEEQVLYMLNFKKGDNMLLLNRKEQAQALPNKLPYVKSAVIKLALPGTVVITIENAQQKYYVPGEDGTFTYLDQDLKVLETGAATPPAGEDAVSLEETAFKELSMGSKATFKNEKIGTALTEILKAIDQIKLPKVTAIQAVNETTNFVVYDGRITIKLGEAVNVEKKLTMAKTSIESTKADNLLNLPETKGTLDVTVGKYAYFTAGTS